jgi:hypothetical protein
MKVRVDAYTYIIDSKPQSENTARKQYQITYLNFCEYMKEEQEAKKCWAYQGQGKQGLAAQRQQQSEPSFCSGTVTKCKFYYMAPRGK